MDPRTRQQLTHYGVPAAFLAAVTIAVILIKAGLNGGSGSTTTAGLPTTPTTTKAATTTLSVRHARLFTREAAAAAELARLRRRGMQCSLVPVLLKILAR